jgi:hypothetical protein
MRREVRNELAAIFADHMKKVRSDAKVALEQAAERMNQAYTNMPDPPLNMPLETKFISKLTNIKPHYPSRKLSDKCYGPFKVLKKRGESAYKLKLPDTWPAIHPVINESNLSPYKPVQYHNQQKPPPPPPVDIEGELEYNVKEM